MSDSVKAAFKDTMRREQKTVCDYWTNQDMYCFFRRNTDNNQMKNSITAFYDANTDINAGSLLKFNNTVFLALNKETIENEHYRRSDLIETNMILNTISNGYEVTIPCFAYDITSVLSGSGNSMSVVSGTVELITQKNIESNRIMINNEFTAMGGTYKVSNIYDRGNIKHIFVERQTNNADIDTYTLEIVGEDSRGVGSETEYSVLAKVSGEAINNPTIQWTSSNRAIVSINSAGIATFNSEGSATITAYWVEHEITATKTVSTVAVANLVSSVLGNDEIEEDSTEIYTAVFYDANNIEVEDITPTWSLTLTAAQEGHIAIVSQSENTVSISASDASEITGTSFTLNMNATGYAISKIITIIEQSGGGWV